MLQNRNFPVQRYVCISSRGPLPPLDLELYSRASQAELDRAEPAAEERLKEKASLAEAARTAVLG